MSQESDDSCVIETTISFKENKGRPLAAAREDEGENTSIIHGPLPVIDNSF